MKWRELNNEYAGSLAQLSKKSPHEVLGVDVDAPLHLAKAAWRKKVSLYHPDRADPFMKAYAQDVVKILNEAMESVEKNSPGQGSN
jgi:DnaJ-class molecular chaperone